MSHIAKQFDRAARTAARRRGRFTDSPGWSTGPRDLLAEAAASAPDRTAVIERDRQATYAQLDRAATAAARRLESRGVCPGDAVLLVVQNDLASIVGIHAALRLGARLLIAPASAGPSQLAAITEEATPSALMAPAQMIVEGRDLPCDGDQQWEPLPSFEADSIAPEFGRVERGAEEPCLVLFTSGTTSRPKGVIHSIGTLVAATSNFVKQTALETDDRLFVVSPLASITGLLQCITTPCLLRAAVVLETKWDPARTCDLLIEHGGTFFGGPDVLLDRLLSELEARGKRSTTLRVAILGGAALNPRILARVEDSFGIAVLRAYGSSEAPVSTAGHVHEDRELRLRDDGAPLGGVEVRRGSMRDASELCITGPHLFLGYLDEADDAQALEIDEDGREWFRTGDVAELSDGRLRIVGRLRDIVIRNGLKVPINEVETYMNRLPEIERAAGFAVDDPSTGERLCVAVIPRDGAEISYDRIVAALKEAGLARWKLPEEIVLWDGPFPENATGKIMRLDLSEQSAERRRMVAPRLQGGPKQ